jgi:hypothetical protein
MTGPKLYRERHRQNVAHVQTAAAGFHVVFLFQLDLLLGAEAVLRLSGRFPVRPGPGASVKPLSRESPHFRTAIDRQILNECNA